MNLNTPNFILLDGAVGTELLKRGFPVGKLPETAGLTHPELLLGIYKSYLNAGSGVICADTFCANSYKLAGSGYTAAEVVQASVELALRAVREAGSGALVALDVGPCGQLLAPAGTLRQAEAYSLFAGQIIAGAEAGADLILIETMSDLLEIKTALLAAKENTSLPVLCSMTFAENGRTFLGCGISEMALTLEGLGADVLGINCSLGPRELLPFVGEFRKWTTLPLLVKPNAGLPDPISGAYGVAPSEFADIMAEIASLGVKFLGGCCGTGPEHISELARRLEGRVYRSPEVSLPPAVCGPSKTVILDRVRVIGERINPTGKKRFQEALLKGDDGYIMEQAVSQLSAGADMLDVNVGMPGLDEREAMLRVVGELQGITGAPLQLDSSDPAVLEAALRAYSGKPIINSVNGKRESLTSVLPIVKKYGAAVIGLTLDEGGIPKTAEERLEIAERIVSAALEFGIKREDVYIDCLAMTVAAEQEAALETIRALRLVTDKLKVKTVLGVSNVSYGLPNRELMNQTFLALALGAGLDLAIINPGAETMTNTVRAFNLLSGADEGAREYTAYFSAGSAAPALPQAQTGGGGADLGRAVESGLKEEAARAAGELLPVLESSEIAEGMIIPALDKAGAAFERGEIFLPQLIQCAAAAQAAFDVIYKEGGGAASSGKGNIILATVKGDIHDIGKNIVKILLKNYGYNVADLGRDVSPDEVLAAVLERGAALAGLSALMTTTLPAMAETVRLLREKAPGCRVMIGGAVVSGEYARSIGADFYGRDARSAVAIAREVFG